MIFASVPISILISTSRSLGGSKQLATGDISLSEDKAGFVPTGPRPEVAMGRR
jgi:hypothetical protein